MSQISKCPKVTVILSYWEALGEVSKLRYKRLLYCASVGSYCTVLCALRCIFLLWCIALHIICRSLFVWRTAMPLLPIINLGRTNHLINMFRSPITAVILTSVLNVEIYVSQMLPLTIFTSSILEKLLTNMFTQTKVAASEEKWVFIRCIAGKLHSRFLKRTRSSEKDGKQAGQ